MIGAARQRAGTTLIELLVVLTILATLAGVAALAMRRVLAPGPVDASVMINAVRRRAMTTGRETTLVVMSDGRPLAVALYPDGRALADPPLHLDPLTGRRADASH